MACVGGAEAAEAAEVAALLAAVGAGQHSIAAPAEGAGEEALLEALERLLVYHDGLAARGWEGRLVHDLGRMQALAELLQQAARVGRAPHRSAAAARVAAVQAHAQRYGEHSAADLLAFVDQLQALLP